MHELPRPLARVRRGRRADLPGRVQGLLRGRRVQLIHLLRGRRRRERQLPAARHLIFFAV